MFNLSIIVIKKSNRLTNPAGFIDVRTHSIVLASVANACPSSEADPTLALLQADSHGSLFSHHSIFIKASGQCAEASTPWGPPHQPPKWSAVLRLWGEGQMSPSHCRRCRLPHSPPGSFFCSNNYLLLLSDVRLPLSLSFISSAHCRTSGCYFLK